jgi:hypothetical protein
VPIKRRRNHASSGDEHDPTDDITSKLNAGWTTSLFQSWGDEDGVNKWSWSAISFTIAARAALDVIPNDIAAKIGVFTTAAVPIAMGSCPSDLTKSGTRGILPPYSLQLTVANNQAMDNCEFSRVRLEFAPGTYTLAIW